MDYNQSQMFHRLAQGQDSLVHLVYFVLPNGTSTLQKRKREKKEKEKEARGSESESPGQLIQGCTVGLNIAV